MEKQKKEREAKRAELASKEKEIVWHKTVTKRQFTPPPKKEYEDYLKTLKEERISKGIPLVENAHNWEKDL